VTVAPHSLLVLGGARSGKSRHALEQARQAGSSVAFLATARALDGDMAIRIARHRAERPARWTTIEEPLERLLKSYRDEARLTTLGRITAASE